MQDVIIQNEYSFLLLVYIDFFLFTSVSYLVPDCWIHFRWSQHSSGVSTQDMASKYKHGNSDSILFHWESCKLCYCWKLHKFQFIKFWCIIYVFSQLTRSVKNRSFTLTIFWWFSLQKCSADALRIEQLCRWPR